MNVIRKAISALGGIFLAALLIAALVPKVARGVAAALVQIVPGTTTHVGQNESQLVSLTCPGVSGCYSVDPAGETSFPTLYVVPSGYTLIVTDWEWVFTGKGTPGNLVENQLVSTPTRLQFVFSLGLIQSGGGTFTHEHYETPIRVASGVTIEDFLAANGDAFSAIQGYLVPND